MAARGEDWNEDEGVLDTQFVATHEGNLVNRQEQLVFCFFLLRNELDILNSEIPFLIGENYMVRMLLSICYISALKLGLYDLVSCCITLIFHLVFTSFHTDFGGFPYEKTGYVVLMIFGYDYF